jgi:hypothetical protein
MFITVYLISSQMKLVRRGNNSEHLKDVECFNCGEKGHYYTDCSIRRKNDNEQSNMVSKADFKNLFQSSLKEMLTKKDKQAKKNAEGDDDSLDMNVCLKFIEGKHTKIVNKSNDDLIIINDTDVKLLPLPQPPLRARTDARTNPSAQRATQLRSVLARVYAVAR